MFPEDQNTPIPQPVYGGTVEPSEPPTETTPIDPNSTVTYTWPTPRRYVCIQSKPLDGPTLYLRWNREDAGEENWEVCLLPGDSVINPPGVMVAKVSLYSPDGGTPGSDFAIYGWP